MLLIVEDDQDTSEIMRFFLAKEGFEVRVAKDAETAERFLRTEKAPDAILLDIMLPGKDGYALVQEIRASERWQDVPVMMVSGKAHEDDVRRALLGGANDYLVKPFKPRDLAEHVRRLIATPTPAAPAGPTPAPRPTTPAPVPEPAAPVAPVSPSIPLVTSAVPVAPPALRHPPRARPLPFYESPGPVIETKDTRIAPEPFHGTVVELQQTLATRERPRGLVLEVEEELAAWTPHTGPVLEIGGTLRAVRPAPRVHVPDWHATELFRELPERPTTPLPPPPIRVAPIGTKPPEPEAAPVPGAALAERPASWHRLAARIRFEAGATQEAYTYGLIGHLEALPALGWEERLGHTAEAARRSREATGDALHDVAQLVTRSLHTGRHEALLSARWAKQHAGTLIKGTVVRLRHASEGLARGGDGATAEPGIAVLELSDTVQSLPLAGILEGREELLEAPGGDVPAGARASTAGQVIETSEEELLEAQVIARVHMVRPSHPRAARVVKKGEPRPAFSGEGPMRIEHPTEAVAVKRHRATRHRRIPVRVGPKRTAASAEPPLVPFERLDVPRREAHHLSPSGTRPSALPGIAPTRTVPASGLRAREAPVAPAAQQAPDEAPVLAAGSVPARAALPPGFEEVRAHVAIRIGGTDVAETDRAIVAKGPAGQRVYYVPMEDVRADLLDRRTGDEPDAEHGARARYDVLVAGHRTESAAWTHPEPVLKFAALEDYFAFDPRQAKAELSKGDV